MSFGDYLDACVTVAAGASLLLWAHYFGLNPVAVGIIGMVGAHGSLLQLVLRSVDGWGIVTVESDAHGHCIQQKTAPGAVQPD